MELTRSSLVASGAPVSFWDHAVTHAVDILSRTSGPPNTNASSFELLTGEKPRVMSILPFGCRAFAVKPRIAFLKTRMEPRAWVGLNLGRSMRSPSSHNVWVPSSGRIVVSSDVYFDETLYPWRNASRESRALAQRADGDSQQPPGLPPLSDIAADAALPAPRTLRNDGAEEHAKSRRVLLLFFGPFSRPDGLSAFLARYGVAADCIDNAEVDGGGRGHNILVDSVYERLLQRCADKYYAAVIASLPCFTFSVSLFFHCNDAADGGPPPVRDRDNVMGLPAIPAQHQRELAQSNEIVRRTTALLRAAHTAGAEFILDEHPAGRGALASPIFNYTSATPPFGLLLMSWR
eukprot:6173167-Pleurochrysis_carterae.AAC.4